MKRLTLIVFLLSAICATAADTKPVVNRDGNCVVSVPSNWTVDSTFGSGTSPDKKVSIIVSSPKHGLATLSDAEELAPTMYKDDRVTKKSASEFEMEGKSISGKPNFYRAVPAGAKICIAEITYESGAPNDAKAIIETLKAK